MSRFFRRIIAALSIPALIIGAAACSGSPSFKVKGNITGAEGKTILLEKSDFSGRWLPVDSAVVGSDDSFSIAYDAPASPEIFRLNLGGHFIYIPVDSTETLTLKSSAAAFGTDHTLEGNRAAPLMAAFDKEALRVEALANPDSTQAFKRRVFSEYIHGAKGSILSWYIVTKTMGGAPLFSYTNPEDAGYLAAIATDYRQFAPDDPHTPLLEQMALQAMKTKNTALGKKRVMKAESSAMIDINLPDADGRNVALSSMLGKGRPVVVVFSVTTAGETSGKLTMAIRSAFDKLNGRADFYQVCLDPDPYTWRESVKSIPWITVIDTDGSSSATARNYNVTSIPAFFIYNAAGELIDKTENPDEVAAKVP